MTSDTSKAVARSGMVLAAFLMMLAGAFQFFQGISAVVKDDIYLNAPNYIYKFDTTTWGWIHLILGAIVAISGFFLYQGKDWARGVAIVLAGLAALSQFFFIPYYPLWAILIIALDIFIIWAIVKAPAGNNF
ncbi:DUF7144 family membrane protein [Rhizocola hellebori]|uniref:DUF7144 family membrane protein n=1 Tax=Rhizocola hellebori TaxID=1392758 RepID=UPI0019405046|nr:hypothetical protein [Rhizocola hellebori]